MRPRSQTVNYFPHMCTHSRTMFILEQKWGNDGYSFWFKLLEMLGNTAGHYLDLTNEASWEFLQAKTRLGGSFCNEMLNMLAKLEAIDQELWSHRIVWSQNFVDGVAPVYQNRRVVIPQRPDNYNQKPDADIVSTDTDAVSTCRNPLVSRERKEVEEVEEVEYSPNGLLSTTTEIVDDAAPKKSSPPYQEIVSLYHEVCTSLPKIKNLSKTRKTHILARWNEHQQDLDAFRQVFQNAESSDFLSGRSGKWSTCNLDWLILPANWTKVIEGTYNRDIRAGPSHDQEYQQRTVYRE